ncbi:hypothetical protein ACFSSA_05055 [Luteolibacter algae]|uniref:Pilin accessory protein (PilO) n=1 Tax=Luteolibacter algae TaxID=454151 RepID=A0ABW5D4N4_9BACT
MAKNTTTHLLIPGETSWEIWTKTADGAVQHSSHPVEKPSEIDKFPSGDLIFFFPVRSFTALPLRVNTGDESLFSDLAATHAERVGLRPDPFAGQLTDNFPIFINSEASSFLSVVLRNPGSGDLPQKSPKAFDISPRSFSATGNHLTLWRELGYWVFAIHQEGKLLYCQATNSASESPDSGLIREIRIAFAQLSMQGIEVSTERATVWSSSAEIQTTSVSESLSLPVEVAPCPAPVLPESASKLLPADVRAARHAAQKRQNMMLGVAAIGILYLGTIAYLGFQLWQTKNVTDKLNARITAIAPEGEAYALHRAKWDELAYAIDMNYNTVDILNRVARSIPPNSGLRLRTADVSPTEVRVIGEAPQPQAVNQFSLNLSKNNDLLDFDWQTPEPKQSNRGWEFVFTGATQQAF